MATTAQVMKLRRLIQDLYDKRTSAQLATENFAFKDEELLDILDGAAAEATSGTATAESMSPFQESLAMLLARADAVLQIAQDEARRIKWQTNNEVVDPTQIAKSLIAVAQSLQARYNSSKDRTLKEDIAGVNIRNTGGIAKFNDSVRSNSERNFDNRTVRRNSSPDHRF